MKVLMTADTVGGVWSYALELCHAFRPHGIRVALATMGAPLTAEQREAVRSLPNVDVHESAFRLEWMDEPWRDVAAAGEWLLELAAAFRPDVIHLNGYVHAALPWQRPVLVTAHSCVLSWWDAVHGAPAPDTWTRYAAAVRQGLRAADVVAAPTRALLDSCERHYGPLPPGVVIPNGVGAAPHTGAAKQPFVLAAGRVWDEAKNIVTLDAAAPGIIWPVRVAGPDHVPGGTPSRFQRVALLGPLSRQQMHATYGAAAIFAHPALYEPFGLAPLEAALHGCALVLGDVPSLREVWGDSAVFVPPRDAQLLAAAINDLAHDAGRRSAVAASARQRALGYTAERMAEGYRAVYRALVLAHGRRKVAACV